MTHCDCYKLPVVVNVLQIELHMLHTSFESVRGVRLSKTIGPVEVHTLEHDVCGVSEK